MRVGSGAAALVGTLVTAQASAAAPTAAIGKLGLTNHPVELPGILRVLCAFVLVAALVVCAAVAIKRFSPAWLARFTPQTGVNVSVLARERLEPGTRMHIVLIGEQRLLIVTSRAGLAVHPLPNTGTVSSLSERSER